MCRLIASITCMYWFDIVTLYFLKTKQKSGKNIRVNLVLRPKTFDTKSSHRLDFSTSLFNFTMLYLGEQGWRSTCSERFFSGYSGFPLSSKTNISKFQFDLESEGHKFISVGLLRATLVKQRLFID